jgi:hypothetical protein
MPKRLYTSGGSRRGIVAVFVALMLTIIVGTMAIALDGGLLQHNKRRVQATADAAALAAATELFKHWPAIVASNYVTFDPSNAANDAAQNYATYNGFKNDTTNAVVTVNIPPASGPFKGKVGYAEVIITYNQPRYFSGIWGSSTAPVTARAVARGSWAGSNIGIMVLDPSQKDSLNASGGGTATVTGGASVIVDSNNSEAAAATGGSSIVASDFEITGGETGNLTGTIHTGTPPQPDPLRTLPVPTMPPAGNMTTKSLGMGNKQYTLTPGTYTNLPNFSSGDQVVFEQASYNSNGGIFYINGGGFKSTGATISMDPNTSGGVMIYNAPSSSSSNQGVDITGNSSGSVNLSALTSGPYAGMLMWQDRTSSVGMSIAGQGSFDLEGTFYVANANLKVTGSGTATIGSQYISRTLTMGGGGAVKINYTDGGTAPLREVRLVE